MSDLKADLKKLSKISDAEIAAAIRDIQIKKLARDFQVTPDIMKMRIEQLKGESHE